MAHIFASHSQRDKSIIHFFLEAFAGTNVKPHFEELEAAPPGGLGAQKITADIQSANAIFVLLSENVAQLNHTRDWVNWECGTALNKEI
jgi:monoamine oxidase